MWQAINRHFDVVVVTWALALAVCWMLIVLGRTDLTSTSWGTPVSGPAWVIQTPLAN